MATDQSMICVNLEAGQDLSATMEASMEIVPRIKDKVGCIVDLSAAYRMKDASVYPKWYGFEHTQPLRQFHFAHQNFLGVLAPRTHGHRPSQWRAVAARGIVAAG